MKRLFVILLAVAILVPSFGAGIPQAKAVESTNAELEQMVQQLLTTVAQLRAQLDARNAGGVLVSPSPSPSQNPTIQELLAQIAGLEAQITQLQMLISQLTIQISCGGFQASPSPSPSIAPIPTETITSSQIQLLLARITELIAQKNALSAMISSLTATLAQMPPCISVQYPAIGESLIVGTNYSIKWTNRNIPPDALISVNIFNGTNGTYNEPNKAIAARLSPGTTSYTWRVAPNDGTWGVGKQKTGDKYVISVSAISNSGQQYALGKSGVFTILSGATNQAPVITGISGPSTLQVGQMGTWTINAYDPEQGNLSYSVDWEGTAGKPAPSTSGTKQAATFTHVYYNAGTYTPRFTVTDNQGLTAQSSLSVVVGGGTTVGTAQFNMGSPYFPTSQNVYVNPGATWATISSFTVKNNSNTILSLSSLEFFLSSFPQDKKGIASVYIFDGSSLIASSPVSYPPPSGGMPRVFFFNLQDDIQILPNVTKVYTMKADILPNAPVGMTQQIAIAGVNSVLGGPRIVFGNIDGNKVIISEQQPTVPSIETSLVSGVGVSTSFPTGGTRFNASFKINVTARNSDVIIEPGAFKESLFNGNQFVQSISTIDNQSYTIPKNQTKLVSVESIVICPPPISFGRARLDSMKWKSTNGVYSTHKFPDSYMTSPAQTLTPDPVYCPLPSPSPSPSPSPTPTKPPSVDQDTSLTSSQLANTLESARKALAEILKMIQSR